MMKAKRTFTTLAMTLTVVSFAVSCMPSVSKNSLRGRTNGSLVDNSTLKTGEGKVLLDNPIILSNNTNLDSSADLNRYLSSAVKITENSFLNSNPNCYGLTYCFQIMGTRTDSVSLQTANGKWGYSATSDEFTQVNVFYHLNAIYDRIMQNLSYGAASSYDYFGTPLYDTSIPKTVQQADGTYTLNTKILSAIANCDSENNASWEPAQTSLCFGFTNTPSVPLRWGHDSTVVYHEAGHFFQEVFLNLRNSRSLDREAKPAMGNGHGYSESGALGEGLSDYFSYYINGRTHFAEWAAGRYLGASRPISESDSLHAAGISADRDQRLSYPDYIDYDVNHIGRPLEDVHSAGMIISHYLVALTEDIKTKCSMTTKQAQEEVMHVVAESLSELGDLTTKGTANGSVGKVNMSTDYALDWFNVQNPINYRSLTQTLAKNLLINIGNPLLNRCNGSYYQKDDIESLLDDYGLLLFKTYNQHRNIADFATKINTAITSTNRKKSMLVPKSALIFDPASDASIAYVFDKQKDIKDAIANFKSAGHSVTISDQIKEDLPYNNGNSKISPGEVVGIALNLYNNSNTTIGGVQILANDWDHADNSGGALNGHPCQFSSTQSNDTWPLESEGASTAANCSAVNATSSDFAPICFIQSNESNSTKWISQKEFRQKLALDNNFCLTPGSEKDCFVRVIKNLDTSSYSKINPKATWGKTFTSSNPNDPTPKLSVGHLFFMEVSKHIPPGTVIDCRVRARFTNCEDCYHDSTRSNYDYKDVDYNGPKPFKVFHLQIPITD
jgi:hypothetical protein